MLCSGQVSIQAEHSYCLLCVTMLNRFSCTDSVLHWTAPYASKNSHPRAVARLDPNSIPAHLQCLFHEHVSARQSRLAAVCRSVCSALSSFRAARSLCQSVSLAAWLCSLLDASTRTRIASLTADKHRPATVASTVVKAPCMARLHYPSPPCMFLTRPIIVPVSRRASNRVSAPTGCPLSSSHRVPLKRRPQVDKSFVLASQPLSRAPGILGAEGTGVRVRCVDR